jgi:hypothetical protein
MNTIRLRQVVDLLLKIESDLQIQSKSNEALSSLSNIISQPQSPNFQTQFASILDSLHRDFRKVSADLQPIQISLKAEIGGAQFFVEDIGAFIEDAVKANVVTPAVARDRIQSFLTQRENYIGEITKLRDSLKAVGIEASSIQPGDAEIGILIPRTLFDNDLELLIKELSEIKFIVRAFSELALGTSERIEVRQISTTDPQFFLHVDIATVIMIGAAAKWAIDRWKDIEDIRKVRAETRKLSSFTEKEVTDIFDTKISTNIEQAIEVKTEELIDAIRDKGGVRINEQRQHIKLALQSLLARTERGMTVEIQSVPPPLNEKSGKSEEERIKFAELESISKQLVFPKPDANPILKLPDAERKVV